MRFWRAVEIITLGLWLGAVIGFGVATAPVLFQIVESRQVAGNVAGSVIYRLEWAGLLILGMAAAAQLRQVRAGGPTITGSAPAGSAPAGSAPTGPAAAGAGASGRRLGAAVRLLLVSIAAGLVIVGLTWVRSGLDQAQARMDKPIELYAPTDARRVEYNIWHQRSRTVGNFYVLSAFLAFVWAAGAGTDSPRSVASATADAVSPGDGEVPSS